MEKKKEHNVISFRLDKRDKKILKEIAIEKGVTLSHLFRTHLGTHPIHLLEIKKQNEK